MPESTREEYEAWKKACEKAHKKLYASIEHFVITLEKFTGCSTAEELQLVTIQATTDYKHLQQAWDKFIAVIPGERKA